MFYRRSIFLINRRFQLRFSFYVCSWLLALSLAYPLIISNLFDYFIRYLSLDPMGPTLTHLEKTRSELIGLLIVMQLILISLTFLISVFMSHRIAGPLYQLRKVIEEAKAGKPRKLTFRKRDYFQELAPEFNEMMDAFQNKATKQAHGIQLAISKLEGSVKNSTLETRPSLEAALAALREAEKS